MLNKNNSFSLSAITSVFTAIASGLLLASQVSAQVLIQKPGALRDSAEAGRVVAQFDNVTIAGAMQDTIVKSSEPPIGSNTIAAQGAVYVFEDAQVTPKATYQFPGGANTFRQLGARVAASGKWLAFTDTNTGSPSAPARVYVVGKDVNNQWRTCPVGVDGADCSGSVDVNGVNTGKPIKSIDFDQSITPGAKNNLDQNIAISDNYLVTANVAAGVLDFYRYDTAQNKWIKETTYDDPVDANKTGTAIAIDGERVVVSAPKYNSNAGRFYAFERNASTQQWQLTHTINGSGLTTGLGESLDFHNTRILATVGTTWVAHYRIEGAAINLKNIVNGSIAVTKVSLFNDTAVFAYSDANNSFGTYKLNSATNAWDLVANVPVNVVPAAANGLFLAQRDIDLHKNNIVVGWAGRVAVNSSNAVVQNVGAIVLKDFSASNCKSVINLVPNCSFDIPTATNWNLLTYNGANATPDYTNGELKTTINDDGYDFWHIQARTAVKFASAGTYTLRFKARADWTRTIVVNLGHNGASDNNWQSYSQHTVTLSAHMQTYSITLNSIPQDLNAVLDFNMGNAGNSPVTIDEIYLSRNP